MTQNPYSAPKHVTRGPRREPTNHAFAPGIILLILGSLWLIFALASIPINIMSMSQQANPDMPPDQLKSFQAGQYFGMVIGVLVYMTGSLIAIIGGIAMIRGKGYRTAFVSAIVACIPCLTPCFILGIPFGIWAIIALNNPETKAFFNLSNGKR